MACCRDNRGSPGETVRGDAPGGVANESFWEEWVSSSSDSEDDPWSEEEVRGMTLSESGREMPMRVR